MTAWGAAVGLVSLPARAAGGIKLPVSWRAAGPCGEFGVDGGQVRQDRPAGR